MATQDLTAATATTRRYADNVLIHPAAKRGPKIGGRGWGWSMKDVAGSQAIRNIFAHATGGQNNEGLKLTEGVLVEDYVRYQWHEHENLNPTGQPFPDPNRTIMTYDRDLGSGKGTLKAFMAEATAQERDNWRHQYTAKRSSSISNRDSASGRKTNRTDNDRLYSHGGDRVRWDNWRNWSTDDLPFHGDTVHLDGHEVYCSGTRRLENTDRQRRWCRPQVGLLARRARDWGHRRRRRRRLSIAVAPFLEGLSLGNYHEFVLTAGWRTAATLMPKRSCRSKPAAASCVWREEETRCGWAGQVNWS